MSAIGLRMLRPEGADALAWETLYRRLPWGRRSLYFSPGYARCQEIATGDRAFCAVAFEMGLAGGDYVLQPFLLRADPAGHVIESLYGYGGPTSDVSFHGKMRAALLFAELERLMVDFRKEHRVVCERVVLTPTFAEEQRTLYRTIGVEARRVKEIVVMPTAPDKLANAMTVKRAAAVRKAIKDGIEVTSTTSLGQSLTRFWELYSATMERAGAAPRWRHQRNYFEAYLRELKHRAILVEAFVHETSNTVRTIVSSALLLMDGAEAQYQFAGNSGVSGASDLVITEAARLAYGAGCWTLDLGGGVTAEADDPLLWYKGSFSSMRRPVWVVERVHDREAFDKASAGHAVAGFFPPWRAGAGMAQMIGGSA